MFLTPVRRAFAKLFLAFLFFVICMIPAYADAIDNTINIGTTIYTVVNDPKYSNNTFTPAAGAHNEIVSNKLSIFYNALTTTQINAPDLTLEKNILDLAEGYSFSQTNKVPVAAVELRFTNNNSLYSTDLTNFAPAVKDNTLNVTYYSTDLSGVQGNLFGALVETENSNIGSLVISSNTVNSAINTNETGTQIFGAEVILNASGTGAVPVMTTDLTDNKVNITDGTLRNEVIGGEILGVIKDNGQGMNISGNVKDNIVTITKGTIVTPVVGGVLAVDSKNDSKTINLTGNVTGNELVINGGLYQTGAILVGGSLSLEGYGAKEDSVITSAVQNNKITISGGDFYNTLIVGGVTTSDNKRTSNNATAAQTTGAISGNTIEISGTANISDSYSWLSGGFTTGTNSYKNNTLILKKSGISVYGVDGFDTYEFDVTGAGNGTVYLSSAHGNGHNNTLYRQFDLSTTNGAWDIDGATVNWSTSDGKRPAYLTLGGSAVLLQETSGLGLSGTLTNAETTTDFTDGGVTYTYLLRQSPTSVYLLHNKLTATDWNDNVFVSAGNYSGDDVSMIISGTLKAPSITVASNAAAAATLTAGTLDVTANDTLLNLTAAQDMHKNATFTTINIDNGHNLTKAGNAFYTFTNMNVNSDAQISSLDVVQNAATATLKSGTNTTIGVINLINGGALTLSGAGNYTFDTFNTYGSGTFNGNLNAAGKNMNFLLQDTTPAGATALTVNGNANITGSNVQVGILGGPTAALQLDDQVVLVNASGTLTGLPAQTTGVGMQGLMIKYDFDLTTVGNQLLATVTNTSLNQNTKAFSEGRAATAALINQGADFIVQDGMLAAQQAAEMTGGLATFALIGGGKSRYETGSHVDLTAFNAAVGLTHEVEYWYNADWLLSSFIEYGVGDYSSHNEFFSGNVKGNGNSQYIGLGFLGKRTSVKNSYFEISAHLGRLKTDFNGAVYNKSDADYDYSVPYYAAHAGLGYVWDWTDNIALDLSGKYFWSHQDGKTVSISSGDEIHFKTMDSSRARAGARLNFQWDELWAPYLGAAYEYEFDGKAHATTYGMDIDAPSLKGSSAIAEAGIAYTGEKITLGIGGQIFAGRRRGASGHIHVGFPF